MNFISICSGIEAASVAFGPLGWKAIAFSEIEPFPCAVLAHHYPETPNMGDMSKFRDWPEELFVQADVIVGGPPCQAFSVAGLRNGLNDERGNLTLTYAEMINHADSVRSLHGKPPVIVLYENVPGLLSDKTGAYGCFLAALAGETFPLEPAGGRWTDAGYVLGPKRAIAWRVLDAQHFQLAQRRRRVFVVASARDGFDPATVLFEWDGVRRPSAPARQTPVPVCLTARGAGSLDDRETYIVEEGRRIRHMTPLENERQQGFPDGYTLIPWRKKPAEECPDGPRYRALGNSWAIPVVRWIGQRIDSVLSRGQTRPSHVEAAQKRSTPESGEQRRDRTGS